MPCRRLIVVVIEKRNPSCEVRMTFLSSQCDDDRVADQPTNNPPRHGSKRSCSRCEGAGWRQPPAGAGAGQAQVWERDAEPVQSSPVQSSRCRELYATQEYYDAQGIEDRS